MRKFPVGDYNSFIKPGWGDLQNIQGSLDINGADLSSGTLKIKGCSRSGLAAF